MGILGSLVDLRRKKGTEEDFSKDKPKLKHYCRIFQLDYPEETDLYTEILDEVQAVGDPMKMSILKNKENFDRNGFVKCYMLWIDSADKKDYYVRRFAEAGQRNSADMDDDDPFGGPYEPDEIP